MGAWYQTELYTKQHQQSEQKNENDKYIIDQLMSH